MNAEARLTAFLRNGGADVRLDEIALPVAPLATVACPACGVDLRALQITGHEAIPGFEPSPDNNQMMKDVFEHGSKPKDYGALLRELLARSNFHEMGDLLSIEDVHHIRLLKGDRLGALVQEFPEYELNLQLRYHLLMQPFIRAILDDQLARGVKKFVPGVFEGMQGLVNARLIVQYYIEQVDKRDLEFLRNNLCTGEYDQKYMRKKLGLTGAVTAKYGGRMPVAACDYATHHPDTEVRRTFAGLNNNFFAANKGWSEKGAATDTKPHGWVFDPTKNTWYNQLEARRLLLTAINISIGLTPEQQKVDLEWYIEKVEDLIPSMTPARMRDSVTSLGGSNPFTPIKEAYRKDGFAAVHDCLANHPDMAVRWQFRDIQPDDYFPGSYWRRSDGTVNVTVARKTIKRAVAKLSNGDAGTQMRFDQLLADASQEKLCDVELGPGFSIPHMLDEVYDHSYILALTDFLINHPDRNVKEIFKNLDFHHFSPCPTGLWTGQTGPASEHGWITTGKPYLRYVNVGQVYRVVSEFILRSTDPDQPRSIGLRAALFRLAKENLADLRIYYEGTPRNAFWNTFLGARSNADSIRIALGGYVASREFEKLLETNPHLKAHLPNRSIDEFRTECYERREGSLVRPDWDPAATETPWRTLFAMSDEHIKRAEAMHQEVAFGPMEHLQAFWDRVNRDGSAKQKRRQAHGESTAKNKSSAKKK